MTDYLEDMLPRLVKLRKELHANPELALEEFKTAAKIVDYAKQHTNSKIHQLTETGILLEFNSGINGPSVLIRADIDALPIAEINTFAHRSIIDGKSHKCGHDGHTVILLGLAELLSYTEIKKGKVLLLFQPAEENGKGAEAILNSSYFDGLDIDYVFALHNLPGFKKHQIVNKSHAFNANVKSMIIRLNGKTAHAAEPEMGVNPARIISKIIDYASDITINQPERDDFFLITPVHINMGEKAYGISAGFGEVHLTIRSWSLELFNEKVKSLENFINQNAKEECIDTEISWTQVFYANMNNDDAIRIIETAAKKNELELQKMQHGFKWGEDFGFFTQKYKGAMFGLGAGENCSALHNPDYDFPDEIIPTGIKQFYQIIKNILNN